MCVYFPSCLWIRRSLTKLYVISQKIFTLTTSTFPQLTYVFIKYLLFQQARQNLLRSHNQGCFGLSDRKMLQGPSRYTAAGKREREAEGFSWKHGVARQKGLVTALHSEYLKLRPGWGGRWRRTCSGTVALVTHSPLLSPVEAELGSFLPSLSGYPKIHRDPRTI